MDENDHQNDEKNQDLGKDVAGLAAKGAATYFGGPVGGFVADKLMNSRLGSQVMNRFGRVGQIGGVSNIPNVPAGLASPMPTHKVGINGAGIGLGQSASDEEISQDEGEETTPPPSAPTGGSAPEGGDDDKDKKNKKGFGFGNFSFKDLPIRYKLIAIGVIVGIVVIIIAVAAASGFMPINFLSYSRGVEESNNIQSEYEKFWKDFCSSEEDGCSEEQKKAAKEFQESQLKFYQKLDKLVKKNSLSSKQKYIVLTTIFLGYDIDDFTEGNEAFILDGSDEIDYEASSNVNSENLYEREKDSLKELVKQFKISTAICTYDQILDNGEVSSGQTEPLKDANGNTFTLNFIERISFLFGNNPKEGMKEARETCKARPNGKVSIDDNFKDEEISIDGFYNYLRTTDYLDVRPQLASYFSEYAKNNHLSLDTKTWVQEDLFMVRNRIIDDIKSIVETYIEETGPEFVAPTGRAYWWPIGSLEVSSDGLFASGEPQYTHITSPYGMRELSGVRKPHSGVDLRGDMGTTNVIASLGGVVTKTFNSCVSNSKTEDDKKCGDSYGNYVVIQDTKGNINIYAHLYRDSITVKKDDIVKQGQILGKVGSSGNSTGPHLHFTIKINGSPVNPMDYIDPSDPRPSSSIKFNSTSYTREEFISRVESYYSNKKCTKSGCISFKDQILNQGGAGIIYDSGTSHNVNPEIAIARIESEGYSPGTAHNYFGYGCTNTGGLAACYKFTSFSAGMEEFFSNISKYESAEAMMMKYADIGKYWYTLTYTEDGSIDWGIGGCAYAEYIYPDGIPDRVSDACDVPTGTCTKSSTGACVPTTTEDQEAYAVWQVSKMANTIKGIFG